MEHSGGQLEEIIFPPFLKRENKKFVFPNFVGKGL